MEPNEFKTMRVDDLCVTQAELATLMGVSKETIGNIERKYTVSRVHELAIKHLVWIERAGPVLRLLLAD